MFDVEKIRRDFPVLQRTVHGKPLVYLDTAATAQKPQVVIDAVAEYYAQHNANGRYQQNRYNRASCQRPGEQAIEHGRINHVTQPKQPRRHE